MKKWVPGLSFLALFVCACSPHDRSRDLRAKKPFPVSRSDSGAQPVKVKVKKFVRGSKVEEFNLIAVPDRDEWTVQVTND